jgi:hypothetical protein
MPDKKRLKQGRPQSPAAAPLCGGGGEGKTEAVTAKILTFMPDFFATGDIL